MLHRRYISILGSGILLLAAVMPLAFGPDVVHGQESRMTTMDVGDVYLMIGDSPVWMGNRIWYTVFEPTSVEARFMTPSGEIIILMPLGEQSPGQYLLPWHTTPEAMAMVGPYTFELYFGDEYAAKLNIVVLPAGTNPA